MDNALNNITNLIKQPKPDIKGSDTAAADSASEVKKPKRQIKRPHVGVLATPNISKTPITDTLELRKQENPHTIYKLTGQKKPKFSYREIVSLSVIGMGIISLLSLIKKKK